ncbi:MAG TPA: hypothetical protein VM639_24325 [Dongiaceae bacterium]|nr:hypothetical protein [Dongiaceae bacterium]
MTAERNPGPDCSLFVGDHVVHMEGWEGAVEAISILADGAIEVKVSRDTGGTWTGLRGYLQFDGRNKAA